MVLVSDMEIEIWWIFWVVIIKDKQNLPPTAKIHVTGGLDENCNVRSLAKKLYLQQVYSDHISAQE